MSRSHILIICVWFLGAVVAKSVTTTTKDGSESWGYVEVRPKAHMFWWYYRSPYRVEHPMKPWPVILWLQGGPGASGVGLGNFEEIGPLDRYLRPRNSTWLRKADLLFADNPVGSGYSYVEHPNLMVKTDDEAATDLTILLIQVSKTLQLQQRPFYIVAESYGGKYAVTLGLSLLKAAKLKLNLRGIALGDTWISPEDFVVSWGHLLKAVSRLDDVGFIKSKKLANRIKKEIAQGKLVEATDSWSKLQQLILRHSNFVDMYNFMLDFAMDPVPVPSIAPIQYSRYLSWKTGAAAKSDLELLMNGAIKKKLNIIPTNVTWVEDSDPVFEVFTGDFMKPRINEVDELLAKGINITIYSGQLDIICSTMGTEAWIPKLKWDGISKFLSMERTPIYCGDNTETKGFLKSYKNLRFYWILGAGHFVPVDQPCVALDMIGTITDSPAVSKSK